MQVASIRSVKTIQIRNVPDATHRELRVRAAAAGVSMSEYALMLIERVTSKPTIGEVLDRAQAREPLGATTQEIVDLIRADRGPLGGS